MDQARYRCYAAQESWPLPPAFLQAGRNFGLTTPQLIRRVIFPAVLPQAIVALRIAFGIAWIVLVASEMIAVDSGLGYLIIDARKTERLPSVRWRFRE